MAKRSGRASVPPWRRAPPAHPTYLVADRARSRAEHLHKLAEPRLPWRPRLRAPWHAAQAVVAQAAPQTRASLTEGAPRPPPAPRTVHPPGRQPRARAGPAGPPRGRTACACAAAAHQALAPCAHDGQATFFRARPLAPTPPSKKRGRPGPGAPPAPLVSPIVGALASRSAARQARVDQPRGGSRATHERAARPWPARAGLAGYQGPAAAARGGRCLQAPQGWAASLSLKKPARLLALVRVRPVGLLG